jgi:hypothetical protein
MEKVKKTSNYEDYIFCDVMSCIPVDIIGRFGEITSDIY